MRNKFRYFYIIMALFALLNVTALPAHHDSVFVDGADSEEEYEYEDKGALTKDLNRGSPASRTMTSGIPRSFHSPSAEASSMFIQLTEPSSGRTQETEAEGRIGRYHNQLFTRHHRIHRQPHHEEQSSRDASVRWRLRHIQHKWSSRWLPLLHTGLHGKQSNGSE